MRSGKILLGAAAAAFALFAYCAQTVYSAEKNGVAVSDVNFPDPAFRRYVSENLDADGNSVLSSAELAAVKSVSVSGMGISSLEGIGYFTELKSLLCSDNKLTELDLSANRSLVNLSVSGNKLSEIDLSRNTKLENLDLGMTAKDGTVYGNSITELDLSKNKKLINLSCAYNRLKKLDLSCCPKLEIVKCSGNRLTELNVVGCGNLRQLECYSNSLKKLDLSGNPALTGLYCSDNRLTSLDLRSNRKLKTLFCRYNYITRESKLKLYDKSAMTTCDYSVQYYSGYKAYVTDVNMQYSKLITDRPTDIFNISTGIAGTPSGEAARKAGGIVFVASHADYDFSVSGSSALTVDGSGFLTVKKAGSYEFTLTVKKGNADGTDFVKKFTVSAVDIKDHASHEFEWKCDRETNGGHYRQCFCGEKTKTEAHSYGSKIYQINDRSGKLYNYRACKVCRYADKICESTVLKHAATGITIATLDGTLSPALRLAAAPADISGIKAGKGLTALRAYEIYFTDGTAKLKAGCNFKTSIPLPKGADGESAHVLRVKSDGTLRDMNAEYSSADGTLSFTASVSGTYLIAVGNTPNKNTDSKNDSEPVFTENDLIILRDALAGDNADNQTGLTDMNGDGKIDNKDLILLKNRLSAD